MPYKRKYKKKKRSYGRKRRKTYTSSPTIGKGISPLPQRFKATLRYCDHVTLTPSGSTPSVHVWGANCLWDPYLGVGGHQPRGWDQLMPMFEHATVIGSRVAVQFYNKDTADSVIAGVSLMASVTALTGAQDYTEQSVTNFKMLGMKEGGNSTAVIKQSFNNKFLGIGNPLSSSNLKNTIFANPTEVACYHVWANNPNGSVQDGVECQINIEYIVVFQEPKAVGSS